MLILQKMDKENHAIEKKGVSLHRKNVTTMKPGKRICSHLKEIRRSIAAENELPYHEHECSYEGPCRGTCPYCEAELRRLNQQLQQRILSGKVATVAGIAVSLASLAACGSAEKPDDVANRLTGELAVSNADSLTLPPDTVASEGLVRDPSSSNKKADLIMDLPICGDMQVLDSDAAREPEHNAVCRNDDNEVGEVEGEDSLWVDFDIDPQFPGGLEALMTYLQQHIRYPQQARDANIEGKVYVNFVVEADGSISFIKILRDIGGGCGQEVVRVVKSMPRWIPGEVQGKPVRSQFNLPVEFRLEDISN